MSFSPTIRKFTSDVSWAFIGQLAAMLLGLILRFILGRFLGADDLGLFTMAFTVYLIAGLIGSVGIQQGLTKFVAEHKEHGESLNRYVSTAILTSFAFSVIAGVILFTLSNPIASLLDMQSLDDLIKIIAISIPFLVINDVLLLGLFTGLRRMKLYGLGLFIRSASLIGIALILVSIGWGIEGVVLSILIAEMITLIFSSLNSRKYFSITILNFISTAKAVIRFSAPLFLANTLFVVNTRLDILLIGYFMAEEDVGFYSIAVAVAAGFRLLPGVISTVTYPMMAEYHAKKMDDANEILINRTMKNALIGLSVIGIIIIFASNDILLWILGSDFSASIAPLTVLVLGIIFYGSMGSVGSVFSAIGRPDIPFKLNLVVLVVNIGLDIVLIPRIGIVGAAIGTAVSLAVLTVLIVWFLYRIQGIGIKVITYLYVMLPVFAFTAAFFILRDQLMVYVVGGLMFFAYLGFTYSVTMNYNDKLAIRELVASLVGQRKNG